MSPVDTLITAVIILVGIVALLTVIATRLRSRIRNLEKELDGRATSSGETIGQK